jgi:pimeloyl-ACP methyl ester carboxylesterase
MHAGPPASAGTPRASTADVATPGGRPSHARAVRHPVVLLHGWPQTSYAWRHVQPLLATDRVVVALDLPGVGGSAPPAGSYDKATMADEVYTAVQELGLQRPVLVGHDIGAMVAYAYTRRHAADVAGLVIVDTPLPGIDGWDETATSAAYWHLRFHADVNRGRPTADALVDGRQQVYFRSFIDRFAAHPDAITGTDIAVYADAYQQPERLAAGFNMFRALPQDIADNQASHEPLTTPVLLAFSEYSLAALLPVVHDGLHHTGACDIRAAVIPDSGRWAAEEQPAALAIIIRGFLTAIDSDSIEINPETGYTAS